MTDNGGKQIPYPHQLDKKWEEGVLTVAKNVFNIQSKRSSANDRVLPVESRSKRRQMTAVVDPDHLTTIDANHLESHGPVLRRPVQKKRNLISRTAAVTR